MLFITDYGCPERKQPSLHGRKFNPNPKFLGMAEAYFVCHIGPIFQIDLIYAFIGCPQSVHQIYSPIFFTNYSYTFFSSSTFLLGQDRVILFSFLVEKEIVRNICYKNHRFVKFLYSEKATKFCEIFPLLLFVYTVDKSKGKILQNFVAFSEYKNFTKDSCIYRV